MANWIRIASVSDCPPGAAREWMADGRVVAVFNVEGQFFALDGICPHQGGPLGRGKLCHAIVTCPWHGWRFDVRTGQYEANRAVCHPAFPVNTQGTDLFVDVNG
ncbi:MAG: Rieske (2Fe-2S) protein [Pirellulaceae bacterium]